MSLVREQIRKKGRHWRFLFWMKCMDSGARVMATTHYPELKAYGYNRPGVANASVEFDIETLSPTYRLLIGVPGRSNAFEISKRLGLQEHIIDRAKTFTGTDRGEVESMIASLEDEPGSVGKRCGRNA